MVIVDEPMDIACVARIGYDRHLVASVAQRVERGDRVGKGSPQRLAVGVERFEGFVDQRLREIGIAELAERYRQRLVGAILDPVLLALLDEHHDQLAMPLEEGLPIELQPARQEEVDLLLRAAPHHLVPLAAEFEQRAAEVEEDAFESHEEDYTRYVPSV